MAKGDRPTAGGRGNTVNLGGQTGKISKSDTELLMGLPENERGDIYFHRKGDPFLRNGSISDLEKEAKSKDLAELAKNSAVLFNEKLDLDGTPRQISYAKRLAREAILSRLDTLYSAYSDTSVISRSDLFANAKAQGVAQNMNAVMRYSIAQDEVYKFIKREKNAGKLIDYLKDDYKRRGG